MEPNKLTQDTLALLKPPNEAEVGATISRLRDDLTRIRWEVDGLDPHNSSEVKYLKGQIKALAERVSLAEAELAQPFRPPATEIR